MKGYLATGSGTVPREWIDQNGHMNVVRYMGLFDHGSNIFLEHLQLKSRVHDDFTVVASRIYIEHKKELFADEPWELWTGIITLEPLFMTITHRLTSKTSLYARCDLRSVFFSKRTRTPVAAEPAVLDAAKPFVVVGLTDRFNVN